jgi:hypothetical protein
MLLNAQAHSLNLYQAKHRIYFRARETYSGAVAQLGERDVRNVEARGSIPLSSIFIASFSFMYCTRVKRVPFLFRAGETGKNSRNEGRTIIAAALANTLASQPLPSGNSE